MRVLARVVNVDYAGPLTGDTTANVAVKNADPDGDATFEFGGDAEASEIVSVLAGAGNKGDAILDTDLNTLKTVTVTGDGAVTVVTTEATLRTLDASANKGGTTYVSGADRWCCQSNRW